MVSSIPLGSYHIWFKSHKMVSLCSDLPKAMFKLVQGIILLQCRELAYMLGKPSKLLSEPELVAAQQKIYLLHNKESWHMC